MFLYAYTQIHVIMLIMTSSGDSNIKGDFIVFFLPFCVFQIVLP